ncbi:MAG: DSBA-like protein thioredoxin domain-containing protein [Candidatus Roizmanbacteria bacterium GW2011_GWC2_37_13]|uniref:DSBA-like protein thioredoxin domain-containing protein n=1 Tax=Candidatus Roizmanbacteria bacterium GW2011_GWC2_37_13 TaxID=1618486 RepID=A0A0G0G631_9BACT|nr:MAG: DSBA-like protein thioredoxin domain-containing protein [Candidatus Roizmanbacteria bacterium GW2011_GWC1_37_12]KKQ26573.1 MAG: DSBA-like protein thioredoxin domain-containing protein [Candidatus Roizmanbacteria bacterium GW2011_GWC2_37_13]
MAKEKKASMSQAPVYYSQSNNKILYFMMGIITLFLVFMTIKVLKLEKQLSSGTAGTAVAQQESPISVENLKKLAKELKLNTGKFNKCVDSDEKKTLVEKETADGSNVGVQGTPGFFINGKNLAGAFPYQFFKEIIDKELAGTGSQNCTDYSTDLQQYCSDPQNQAFNPVPKEINLAGTQAVGPENAKVQLVEFSDFECPFCIRAYPTVKQILKDYSGKIRFYYKQFPLTQIHPNAQKAAEASLCAADQGKFWEFHDKMFEVQQTQ